MVDKCNKKNGGKFSKDISNRFAEFQGTFSFDSIVMVIFDGDQVKEFPMENYIVVKPFDPSSNDDYYLVFKLW